MALRLALAIAIVGAAGAAAAQPGLARGPIHGRVVDAAGHPIAGAHLTIDGDASAATTDLAGRFVIVDAPLGADMMASKDGYAPSFAITAPTVPDVVLPDLDQAGETITVAGEPPPPAPGAARLSRDELEHLPGTRNDLGQTLSVMPGVADFPLPLGQAGVVIRGSSPQDSKVLIDGFEVPQLYHTFAFRSVVPEDAIDSLEYLPGGFDVGYGRATSGIVSLTTRAGGDRTRVETDGSSGDLGVVAEGRVHGAHAMLALRRSIFDLLLPFVLPSDLDLALITVPRYYDGLFRVDDELSPRWHARVSGLASDDAMELYASASRDPSQHLYDRTRFARVTAALRGHDGPWTADLALSGIDQQIVTEVGAVQRLRFTSPAVTARAEITGVAATLAGLGYVTWRLGGEAVETHDHIDVALPQEVREGETPGASRPDDTTLTFDGTVVSDDLAGWTSLAAELDPRVHVTAGVRVDRTTRAGVDDVAIQPRGEVAVTLTPALTARLSAGAYARPPEYQSELLVPGLRAERATQLVAGLEYDAGEGVRVQASIYDTERRALITRTPDGTLVNQGTGRSVGAELLATVRRGPWFAWLSYSYAHSTRVDAPGDASRLFDYDQPHNLNALASYKVGSWTLGARFRLSSGLPYTPVTGAIFDSDADVYVPTYGPINSARAELHHELDLRVERTSVWHGIELTRYLDVQNVYLNQSAAAYLYSYDYKTRIAFTWLPILPVIGVRAEF